MRTAEKIASELVPESGPNVRFNEAQFVTFIRGVQREAFVAAKDAAQRIAEKYHLVAASRIRDLPAPGDQP